MTHFDVATARAGEQVMRVAGRSVTLKRGASPTSDAFTAARSRRPSQDLSEENFQTTSDRFRFLIKCSDYKVGGVEVLPAEGDKIVEVTNGKQFTWEVNHDGATRCWDYFDTGNVYLWARVKEFKTEAAP